MRDAQEAFSKLKSSEHSTTSLPRSHLKAKENVPILLSVSKTAEVSSFRMCQRTAKASERKSKKPCREELELGRGLRQSTAQSTLRKVRGGTHGTTTWLLGLHWSKSVPRQVRRGFSRQNSHQPAHTQKLSKWVNHVSGISLSLWKWRRNVTLGTMCPLLGPNATTPSWEPLLERPRRTVSWPNGTGPKNTRLRHFRGKFYQILGGGGDEEIITMLCKIF